VKIDVGTFLELTVALATLSCTEVPPRVPVHTAAPTPGAEPGYQPEVGGSNGPSDPSRAPAETNADGPADLSKCELLSPSCEGMIGECRSLAGTGDPGAEGYYPGFRPRVAEEIALCWTQNISPPNCRPPAMAKCIRDAVMRTSIDPSTLATCEGLLETCKGAGTPARYTLEVCKSALSSVSGVTRDDAVRAMGPMGEGCGLEHALPYYPFGPNW